MSLLDKKIKECKVVHSGFCWKFYTESTGECVFALNPTTYSDNKLLVGLLRTPTGSMFVKLSSVYSLNNLTVEGIGELTNALNIALKRIDCGLLVVGTDIRIARRRVGTYTLAIDRVPLATISVNNVTLNVGESKIKKVYTAKPYVLLPLSDTYNIVEAVNGYHGIDLGTPQPDLASCSG